MLSFSTLYSPSTLNLSQDSLSSLSVGAAEMPEERMVAMMPPKAPGLDRGAKGRKASRRRPLLLSPLVAEAAASPSLAARWTPRPACPPRRAPPRGRARALRVRVRVCARSCGWEAIHASMARLAFGRSGPGTGVLQVGGLYHRLKFFCQRAVALLGGAPDNL